MRRHLLGALLVALTFGPAHADNTVQTIRFPAGKSNATLHPGLVRGAADLSAITARQEQTADIRIASLENNASLMIYQPPAKPVASQVGLDIDSPTPPGGDKAPGLDEGATHHWHGALPASGTYYIVVSVDRATPPTT